MRPAGLERATSWFVGQCSGWDSRVFVPVARGDLSRFRVFGTGLFTDCSLRHQRSQLASVSLSADRQALMLTSMGWEELITVTPGVRSGKPCVRGTRITVQDVLEYLAAGMTEAQILADFPTITSESIRAVLAFAAARERRLASPAA